MPPSGTDSEPGATGPTDRQTLRLLERQLSSDSLVAEAQFDPEDPYEPRLLRASLDPDRYPGSAATARIDIRWFTTGDFSIHYREDRENGQWECRWDCHPNAHNTRVHVHEPPTGAEVSDLELPSLHPLEVYATVFDAIDRRIEALWSDVSHE